MISDTAKSPAVQREGLRLRCRGGGSGAGDVPPRVGGCKEPPAKRNSFRTCLSSLFCHYWAGWERPPAAPSVATRGFIGDLATQRQGTFGRCVGAFFGENPGSAESIFGLGFGATGSGRTGQSSTLPETTHVSLAVRHYDYNGKKNARRSVAVLNSPENRWDTGTSEHLSSPLIRSSLSANGCDKA